MAQVKIGNYDFPDKFIKYDGFDSSPNQRLDLDSYTDGYGAIVYYKVLASHYIGWEVVQMKFDFKDLMEFGMFILALLTLIILISQ